MDTLFLNWWKEVRAFLALLQVAPKVDEEQRGYCGYSP